MSAASTNAPTQNYPFFIIKRGLRLIARMHAFATYKATKKALNELTDRELDDIGVTRADIDDIARRSAYGQ